MRALLDVNVLLALFDLDHLHHRRAWSWLEREIEAGWASCVLTQNGFVRVMSQPGYTSPVSPAEAIERLGEATASEHHELWPCETSLLDPRVVERSHIHGARQVTDTYLLALAVARGGRFVTLDRRIPLSAVVGARETHLVVI